MPILDLSIDELLTTTRAVRKRLDLTRPVEPEMIRECLELAVQAPTPGGTQNWHFIVVTDSSQREALAALYRKSTRSPGCREDILKHMIAAAADEQEAAHRSRMADTADRRYIAASTRRATAVGSDPKAARVRDMPGVQQTMMTLTLSALQEDVSHRSEH